MHALKRTLNSRDEKRLAEAAEQCAAQLHDTACQISQPRSIHVLGLFLSCTWFKALRIWGGLLAWAHNVPGCLCRASKICLVFATFSCSHLFLKHDCMQAKQLIQRDALGRSSGLLSANPRLLVRGLHHEPRTLDPFSAET